MRTILLSLAAGWLMANMAVADEPCKTPAPCGEVQTCGSENCCAHCGARACCEKHCKLVCEMKEVKKTVWVVHCKEFCTTMPGCPLGDRCCHCGQCAECNAAAECAACDASGKKCDPCANLENRNYVPPKCGRVREKKTLEKKEIVCKIPSYKCVVVYSCGNCQAQTTATK